MNAAQRRPTPRQSTLGSLGHPATPPSLAPVPDGADPDTPKVDDGAEAEPAAEKSTAKKKTGGRKQAAAKKGGSNKAASGDASPIRPSMINIPVDVDEQVRALGHEQSHGELVIQALEYCHKNKKLEKLLGTSKPTGGALFAERPTRGTHPREGRKTQLSIRLRVADYEVIDQLVERHGASSRSHLITVALREYLDRK